MYEVLLVFVTVLFLAAMGHVESAQLRRDSLAENRNDHRVTTTRLRKAQEAEEEYDKLAFGEMEKGQIQGALLVDTPQDPSMIWKPINGTEDDDDQETSSPSPTVLPSQSPPIPTLEDPLVELALAETTLIPTQRRDTAISDNTTTTNATTAASSEEDRAQAAEEDEEYDSLAFGEMEKGDIQAALLADAPQDPSMIWSPINGTDDDDQEENTEEDISLGQLRYVGNEHDGYFYARYPLGVCLGDCDTDNDCQEGLYCHQRNKFEETPYCTGGGAMETTADFCAWDTSYPKPEPLPTPPVGAFRLKLYWQEGYLWQNETYDREWCMISDFDGYPGNGECHYGLEVRDCEPNQLYIGKCLEGDSRQWFTLMDVGSTYSGSEDIHESLIGTVDASDTFALPKRCLARRGSQLYLEERCNPKDSRQRFFALSGSFTPSLFDKSRFEISQYQGYSHDNCVTNAHHPKSGEVVEFHVCEHARDSDDETSYWQLIL